MKDISNYMCELNDLNYKLKGMETLLDSFYKHNIENPGSITDDKANYIKVLSNPYLPILDSLRDTISTLDAITNVWMPQIFSV